MYQTKAASQSVGVIAQLVAILIMVAKLAGIDISADLTGVAENAGMMIDGGALLAAQLTALYGRLRADKKITGLFTPTK